MTPYRDYIILNWTLHVNKHVNQIKPQNDNTKNMKIRTEQKLQKSKQFNCFMR